MFYEKKNKFYPCYCSLLFQMRNNGTISWKIYFTAYDGNILFQDPKYERNFNKAALVNSAVIFASFTKHDDSTNVVCMSPEIR